MPAAAVADASISLFAQFAFPGDFLMSTKEELYDQADRLKDAGKPEEAVAKLLELVAQEPDYALAHSALAVLYGRLKRHDEAIRHGLKVCQLEPGDPFSFTAMSVTFQRRQDPRSRRRHGPGADDARAVAECFHAPAIGNRGAVDAAQPAESEFSKTHGAGRR